MTLQFPWSLANGRSLKVDKMRSTHVNSILLDILSSIRQREYMSQKLILIFLVWPVVTLQLSVWLSTKIIKSHYLGFCSSNFKTKDSYGNLSLDRIHGQKPIMIFWVFHLHKSLWLFNFLEGYKIRPVTLEKISKHGFSFFHLNIPFSFESWWRWHFGWLI